MNVCADKNHCVWPRSHQRDCIERFRTSKQTARDPPKPIIRQTRWYYIIPSARKNDALPPSPACRNWPEMAGTRPAMTMLKAAMTGGAASAGESIVWAVGITLKPGIIRQPSFRPVAAARGKPPSNAGMSPRFSRGLLRFGYQRPETGR